MKKWTFIWGILLLSFSVISCGDKNTTTVPSGALRASPASHNFGSDLPVNVESTPKSFVITNTASVDVTDISYGLLNGQDKIFLVGSDCTAVLLAGATCNVTTAIKPDQKGKAFSETYFVKYLTENGEETLSIRLSGSTLSSAGVEIGDSLFLAGTDDPNSGSTVKTFPETTFGSVSDVATLGLTYQGAKPVTIQITPPTNRVFRVVTDCAVLASGERCNMFTSFAPVGVGAQTGTINLSATQEGKETEAMTVTLNGTGIEPTQIDTVVLYPEGNATATEINLGSANIGTLTTPAQNVVLENKSTTSYLYRLTSTVDSMAIDYGTCTGRLNGNESCTFSLTYGPSIVGSDEGYVSFVSGKSTAFIKVKGTATASTQGGTGNVKTDKVAIVFPSTEVGFASEQKTVTITNTGTTPSGRITMRLNTTATQFSYQTTCVDNAPLRANSSCDVSISFRPSLPQIDNDVLAITVASLTEGTAAETINVNLSGTGKPVAITDNTTNVNGLIISEKKFNFPDTGVGLRSASYQFTLRNTGTEDITGFTSTSTDLIRFSLDQTLTTCGSTIAAGSECKIAYRFNASAATQFRSFIKIHATGAEGAGVADAPELVELIGRGVLFNKYIYFGVVEPGSTRDITYAVVNDTNARRELGETTVQSVQWEWTASSSADKNTWFPNNSGEIESKFTRNVLNNPRFSLISDTCKNQIVDPGVSCIIRLRYTPAVGDTEPLSAYITLNDRSGDPIDTLHATASPKDNVSYFFPPDSTEMPRILWDSQSAVIGESIYTFTGTNSSIANLVTADNKLRRYDAARNKWNVVDASGKNPVEHVPARFADSSRMISYNEKLYMYGGNAKDNPNIIKSWMSGLFMFDPAVKKDGKSGEWVRYEAGPTGINNTNIAGYDGKIYVFGGSEGGKWTVKGRQFNVYDLSTNKWSRVGEAPLNNDNIEPTFPSERGSAAIIFFGNKMFLHGGHGNIAMRDDLLEYTAELRDSNGNVTNSAEAGQWRVLTDQINRSQNAVDAADIDKEHRPIARDKHNFDIVGGKLLLKAAGFNGVDGNTVIVNDSRNYYFIFDPSTGGKNNDDNKAGDDVRFHGWTKLNFSTEKLAQHTPSVVDNVLWFHNRTVMGVLFSKEFEDLTK